MTISELLVEGHFAFQKVTEKKHPKKVTLRIARDVVFWIEMWYVWLRSNWVYKFPWTPKLKTKKNEGFNPPIYGL